MRERKDGCRGQEAGKRTGKYGGMKMNREKIRPKKGVALKQNGEREREREGVEKAGEERPIEWRTMMQQSRYLRKKNNKGF